MHRQQRRSVVPQFQRPRPRQSRYGPGRACLCARSVAEGRPQVKRIGVPTVVVALATLSGCGASDPAPPEPLVEPTPAPEGEPWQTLDEWHLFQNPAEQRPANRVVPYDVISVLFADDALKQRFLWIPPGTTIGWHDTERWQFPLGSIAIKTFYYPRDERVPSRGRLLLE